MGRNDIIHWKARSSWLRLMRSCKGKTGRRCSRRRGHFPLPSTVSWKLGPASASPGSFLPTRPVDSPPGARRVTTETQYVDSEIAP
jgi:hypothetical protein